MDAQPSELSVAVLNAERLLQYACAKGIDVPAELIATIVDAKKLLGTDDKDSATFDGQKAFWEALAGLTRITTPATTDSMQSNVAAEPFWFVRLWGAITRSPARPSTIARRAVGWAGIVATLALLCVGVLQLYADVGSSTVQEYAANKVRYEANHSLLPDTPNGTESPADAQRRAETAQLLERSTRQLDIMEIWLAKVPFLPKFKYDAGTPEHSQELLATTELILIVLRGFLLPVGWGFLGASLYVCRTLADDISKMAYSADHRMLHLSRYFLGAVAGFVVAKFSVALSGKPIEDVVQPYVLALLVGYSVDVLFSMFDKLISAFSNK
jgi:hypothetical protein